MSAQVELSPNVEAQVREIVRDEMRQRDEGVQPDWSLERMQAAMQRIVERRKRIGLPPDVVDALIEEHRREFGRGPLVDEDEEETGEPHV